MAKINKTPGVQNIILSKNKGEIEKLNEYSPLVGGTSLYIIEISPDRTNVVRDLACHMLSPGSSHWKAMECVKGLFPWEEAKCSSLLVARFIGSNSI